SQYAQFAGLPYVGVLLNPDFTLDAAAFLRAMAERQPAVVFIDYPNNPSGTLFSDQGIARIIAAAPGLVVIDEAYNPFARKTFMTRLAEFPNLVIMRTLSKLGLAGIRLGYAVGRPEWIREFNKVRPPYNVNVLTLLVAERVLAHYDVLDAQARSINAERERLDGELRTLPGVTVFPCDGHSVFRSHARAACAPRDARSRYSGKGRPAGGRAPYGRGRRDHAGPGGGACRRRQERHPALRPCLRTARRGAVARRDRFFR